MNHIRIALITLALCGATQFRSLAGVVTGTVTDSSGKPVPEAAVSCGKTKARTGADGRFTITIPDGNRKVRIEAPGFTAGTESVSVKGNTTLNVTLKEKNLTLGGVDVTASAPSAKARESEYSATALNVSAAVNGSASLSQLIDHASGVRVRREGGIGSDFDLSINGLSGNSVRYFIDGMPLDSRGSEVSLNNVPLNTVSRIEIYKGVVPSHLGSDALGGAVNIVTKRRKSNYLDFSYGTGSFGTHNVDLTGQYAIPKAHIFIRPTFSYAYSKNNYKMHGVEVWNDETDQFELRNLPRFHDHYRSLFGEVEIGVTDVKWADNLTVALSYSKVDKELQTGATQVKVYGMAERRAHSLALSANYAKRWGDFNTRLSVSHTWDRSATIDTAYRKYAWDGSWRPASGNEINGRARSWREYRRPLTVVNAGVDYDITPHHNIALNYMLNRRGNDRSDRIDPGFEPSNDVVSKHITSFTYSNNLFADRFHSTAFVKSYTNSLRIEQTDLPSISGSDMIDRKATKNYWGAGAGARFTVWEPLAVKFSYEHSVRLPLSRELLGNGTTIYPNLALNPESSNNYNLGIYGTWRISPEHRLTYEAGAFLRHVQNYIRAQVSERDGMMQYFNEPAIRVKGIDLEISYLWRDALRLSVNGSWSDARDLRRYKSDGNVSATYNNRVPNRPWMFGNAEAAYTFRNLSRFDDRLQLSWSWQWIHWYYLNWEAYGNTSTKAKIPTQNISNAAVTYSLQDSRYNITLECNNIFNRLAYDNYMLQKPGRAFYAKFRLFIN